MAQLNVNIHMYYKMLVSVVHTAQQYLILSWGLSYQILAYPVTGLIPRPHNEFGRCPECSRTHLTTRYIYIFQKELVIKCEQEDQAFVKAETFSRCCLYMIQPVSSVSNCLAIHSFSTEWTWCSCISVVPHALVHPVQYATCLVTSQYSALYCNHALVCYVYALVSGALEAYIW